MWRIVERSSSTSFQSQPARGRPLAHLVLGLLERDVQAPLARSRPAWRNCKASSVFPTPDGPDQQASSRRAGCRRRSPRRAVRSRSRARPSRVGTRRRQRRLEPREHLEAVAGDPEAVLAGRDFARRASSARAASGGRQARVPRSRAGGSRPQRRTPAPLARLRRRVLADEDQHRVAVRDLAREVVDRAPELLGRRRRRAAPCCCRSR